MSGKQEPSPPNKEVTPPPVQESPTHVNIKVVNADGTEVFFKIKKTTPFTKMFEAFAQRTGLPLQQIRFSFDGDRITSDLTAEKLKLEEGDVIDALVEQTGG